MLPSNSLLVLLDGLFDKLHDLAAPDTNQMVVMATTIELEDGLPAVEVVATYQPGPFELGQHPIHSGEADLLPVLQQCLVDILGAQMIRVAGFEHVENLDPRQGDFEPRLLDLFIFQTVFP